MHRHLWTIPNAFIANMSFSDLLVLILTKYLFFCNIYKKLLSFVFQNKLLYLQKHSSFLQIFNETENVIIYHTDGRPQLRLQLRSHARSRVGLRPSLLQRQQLLWHRHHHRKRPQPHCHVHR